QQWIVVPEAEDRVAVIALAGNYQQAAIAALVNVHSFHIRHQQTACAENHAQLATLRFGTAGPDAGAFLAHVESLAAIIGNTALGLTRQAKLAHTFGSQVVSDGILRELDPVLLAASLRVVDDDVAAAG